MAKKPTKPTERVEKLKKSLSKAQSMKTPHQNEMRDAYLFTIPSREVFSHQAGTQIDRHKLFDTTATSGVLNLVTLIMRLMIPQNDRWAGVEIRESIKTAKFASQPLPYSLARGLDAFNRSLFDIFGQSNFYLAADEAMHDCVIAGTGCLALYPGTTKFRPIEYRAIDPEQLFFTENSNGMPDIVFREHMMSIRQLIQRWGLDNLPDKIKQEADNNPEAKHKVCEVEEPIDNQQFNYSCYLMDADWHELETQISRFRTFLVFRWQKAANEWWGESQVRYSLPTIRSLNRLCELVETHGEYQAFGLWQSNDTTTDFKNISGLLTPGSVIPLDEELKPIQFGGDFRIGETMLNDLRTQVKYMLFDSPLPSTAQNNYMSATEVNARLAEFFRRIGQPALRLEAEFLEPVVRWTVQRLVHFGDLPKPDPITIAALGGNANSTLDELFAVVVTSATKKVIQVNEAQTDLQAIVQVAQVLSPQVVFKHVDTDKLARRILSDLGITPDLMRSEDEVAALEKQQQQLAAANQVLGAGDQIAGILQKTRGLTNPNASNPASTLTQGLSPPSVQ